MKYIFPLFAIFLSFTAAAAREATPQEKMFYREMVLKIRPEAEFKVPMPANGDLHFNYKFELAEPKWKEPITAEMSTTDDTTKRGKFIRYFWEKVFLKEGSYIEVGGERIALTCINVEGQDNRFSGRAGPLLPEFIMKFKIVANDWTCTGPLNPGWPGNGGRKESWDTYIQYSVKDPTIMLPVEADLRYRWNEFGAILVK
jgi:hypothetical protein